MMKRITANGKDSSKLSKTRSYASAENAMTELDRLMLNFLSSVNALFHDFKIQIRRLAVADDSDKKFKECVRNLEKTNPHLCLLRRSW